MFVGRERRFGASLAFFGRSSYSDHPERRFSRRLGFAERPSFLLLSEVAPPFAAFACQLKYHPA
jgi:hypothetical protein